MNRSLNSKTEYNRSAVPRLGLKLGSSDYTENKEEKAADKKEETLVAKIRLLRKMRERPAGVNQERKGGKRILKHQNTPSQKSNN